ncbi:DNA repair protein RecO [Snuella sedimenti]|uniref:DNA repair protein RecO n=1 Tax=Snuella sedimenti TaxID=2798802 RepID=A0A8J7LNQ9_9FLAO|nr:DNA repair protein RecO [Snuella sedimenti]MBJ6368263.1 DNA repair protein RecO [Snuella sedimenti]
MLIDTHAIVLSKTKYRDHDLIVRCYTKELGVVSFLLKGVFKSKKGQVKAAYFQLLSQLQLVVIYKANRSLQIIKEVRLGNIYTSLHSNVLKSSIVMFLAEVLTTAIKEEEPNEPLYSYVETALLWLDTHTKYANFHLLFLLKLTRYLGFYPDETEDNYNYFNLREGKFDAKGQDVYIVSGVDLLLLKQLLGTTFDELSAIKINSKQRQAFLHMILSYFELHLGGFRLPKSLQVFNQVFN